MGDDAPNVIPKTKGAQEQFIANAMETRLKAMDAMAIDMEVLSINPFGIARTAKRRRKSSKSTMRSWRSFAQRSRIASWPLHHSAYNILISRCCSLRPR